MMLVTSWPRMALTMESVTLAPDCKAVPPTEHCSSTNCSSSSKPRSSLRNSLHCSHS